MNSLISPVVIMEDLAFIGVGISHAAFGGAALGLFLNWDPFLLAFLYSLVIGGIISSSALLKRIKENTLIGIFFSFSMALGYILISLKGSYSNAWGYLFGSIYTLGVKDLWIMGVVSVLLTLWFLLFFKRYVLISFSEELAASYGVPVWAMKALFLVFLSADIVLSIKLVGIILVNTLLIIPGALGKIFGRSFRGFVFISLLSGLSLVSSGFFISLKLDLPPGAVVSLFMSLFLFLSLLYSRLTSRRPS